MAAPFDGHLHSQSLGVFHGQHDVKGASGLDDKGRAAASVGAPAPYLAGLDKAAFSREEGFATQALCKDAGKGIPD
jgi:hypothetical protein